MEGGNRRTLQVLELILQLNDRHVAGAMHTVRRQRLRARKVVAAAVLAHRLQGAIWPPRRLALEDGPRQALQPGAAPHRRAAAEGRAAAGKAAAEADAARGAPLRLRERLESTEAGEAVSQRFDLRRLVHENVHVLRRAQGAEG